MVSPLPADQLDGGAVLVGYHPPAVHFLLLDPALAVERPADQGGLGDVDGGYHSHQYSDAAKPWRPAGAAF